ncbi:mitotic-spindle organizing protein 2-like [Saccoglossus kowalevskii]|uniref:Mitotic-spindle organizing protein 2-like n=1 Tax=Saccoglossus kowalevskii TaxID=10224 RepID=A0ABM0GQM3_SACKO|nr:PREDICTED: mitotic-spindle organizing protein 2-like [Saccoglossus kowalevskii]
MSSGTRPGQTYKYTISTKKSKHVISAEEEELYELCNLAGVNINPKIYRIIADLVRMNVAPIAILQIFRAMSLHSKYANTSHISSSQLSYVHPGMEPSSISSNTSSKIHSSRTRMLPHS